MTEGRQEQPWKQNLSDLHCNKDRNECAFNLNRTEIKNDVITCVWISLTCRQGDLYLWWIQKRLQISAKHLVVWRSCKQLQTYYYVREYSSILCKINSFLRTFFIQVIQALGLLLFLVLSLLGKNLLRGRLDCMQRTLLSLWRGTPKSCHKWISTSLKCQIRQCRHIITGTTYGVSFWIQ